MVFEVRWPDGSQQSFYSPSPVVEEYLSAGAEYPVADFVGRTREALGVASERVREKYGFPCSRAAATVAGIEAAAAGFAEGAVRVVRFRR